MLQYLTVTLLKITEHHNAQPYLRRTKLHLTAPLLYGTQHWLTKPLLRCPRPFYTSTGRNCALPFPYYIRHFLTKPLPARTEHFCTNPLLYVAELYQMLLSFSLTSQTTLYHSITILSSSTLGTILYHRLLYHSMYRLSLPLPYFFTFLAWICLSELYPYSTM